MLSHLLLVLHSLPPFLWAASRRQPNASERACQLTLARTLSYSPTAPSG